MAMVDSCGNACDSWSLCGKWPLPGALWPKPGLRPGLCQEPTSNCTRKEFLESLDLLPLEEQSKPLWLYFSGDSTGRQLCVKRPLLRRSHKIRFKAVQELEHRYLHMLDPDAWEGLPSTLQKVAERGLWAKG
eukprot:g13056.t1